LKERENEEEKDRDRERGELKKRVKDRQNTK
jgi:hypothetical protein